MGGSQTRAAFQFLIATLHTNELPSSGQKNAILQGHLDIGGHKFGAVCDCRPPERELGSSETSVLCNPQKIRIVADHGTVGMDSHAIRDIYGQPRDIEMVDVLYQHFACMDDRIADPSLLTPGGDIGEFLLGLYVLQSTVPQFSLTEDSIQDLLSRYISQIPPSRRFYHCSDDQSVSLMEKNLGLVGLDLVSPPQTQQETLLIRLREPQNHGDAHLKSLLSHPERYHLPKHLGANTILAFYRILWDQGDPNHQKLLLDVLPGSKSPQAFIEVDEGDLCTQTQRAPLFRPHMSTGSRMTSALIVHTAAVSHRRQEIAAFLSIELERMGHNVTVNELRTKIEKYGLLWLESTVAAIAKNLRFYRMTFL